MSALLDRLVGVLSLVISEELERHDGDGLFGDYGERLAALPPARTVEPQSQPVVDEWLFRAVEAAPAPWADLSQLLLDATAQLPWLVSYQNLDPSPALESFQPHYSFCLLAGPSYKGVDPPILSNDMLVGFTLQAPQVTYPAHHHAPPEIYGVMSGEADWQVGDASSIKRSGDVTIHRSHESHAMRTLDQPALTWVAWPSGASHVYMPSLDPPHESMAPQTY